MYSDAGSDGVWCSCTKCNCSCVWTTLDHPRMSPLFEQNPFNQKMQRDWLLKSASFIRLGSFNCLVLIDSWACFLFLISGSLKTWQTFVWKAYTFSLSRLEKLSGFLEWWRSWYAFHFSIADIFGRNPDQYTFPLLVLETSCDAEGLRVLLWTHFLVILREEMMRL